MNAEQLAQFFHETYERLAPNYGYKTREASAKPWAEVPESNKNLMIAVAHEVLCKLHGADFVEWQEHSAKEYERQMAEQTRICACGHAVSDHHNLPAPDGTPYLLCATPPYTCGDTRLFNGFPRCSIPAEVTS
jgi:hypothetical protein